MYQCSFLDPVFSEDELEVSESDYEPSETHSSAEMEDSETSETYSQQECKNYETSVKHSNLQCQENIKHIDEVPLKTSTFISVEMCNSLSRIRRKHHCYYCNQHVGNFARHLERHHGDELQVQEFLVLDKNSKKRKKLIDRLRREGDFSTSKIVPVLSSKKSSNLYIVCKFCRGYYSGKNLRRHAKKCFFNPDPSKRFNAQIEGQTLMAGHFGPNDPLKVSGLLNMLKADEVSMTAKTDSIICEVGRRYIKSHKQKHLLQVAKRYMRRLSRLLILVRKLENNINLKLVDVLKPQKFQILVKASRVLAEYDDKLKTFKSPSLALQIGTLIKNAINTASSLEIQNEHCSKDIMEQLQSLKKLIESDWAHEVSSEAGQNLAMNKFNRPSLLPLAEDIKVRCRLIFFPSNRLQSRINNV